MQTRTTAPMPKYIYMPLPDGKADVFINKFIEEDEDGLLYETNEFRTSKLTEADIASDPFKFLDYKEKEKTDLEKKLDAIIEYMGLSGRWNGSAFAVEKEEKGSGDYTNPIQIPIEGCTVHRGLWYYVDDKELPHEAKEDAFVMREDFDDRNWFDFV